MQLIFTEYPSVGILVIFVHLEFFLLEMIDSLRHTYIKERLYKVDLIQSWKLWLKDMLS